jgi:hypothetical protein
MGVGYYIGPMDRLKIHEGGGGWSFGLPARRAMKLRPASPLGE